jgi:hypothetical protein
VARTLQGALRGSGGYAAGQAQTALLLIAAWIVLQALRTGEGIPGGIAAPLWIVPYVSVPGLSALLGFVCGQSAARTSSQATIAAAARGWFPVLSVAVLGAAFVLGPLLTTEDLQAYFSDPELWLYLLNLLGWPQFALPGVFEFNEYPSVVNEAVWLTPCFAITVALAALSEGGRRLARHVPIFAIAAALLIYAAGDLAGLIPSPAASSLRGGYIAIALAAVVAGQAGTLAYRWRERVIVGWPVLVLTVGTLAAIAAGPGPDVAELPGMPLVIGIVAAYAALAAAATALPAPILARRAVPLGMGAMAFTFPLQQALAFTGFARQSPELSLAVSVPVAVAIGFALQTILTRAGFAGAAIQWTDPEPEAAERGGRARRSWRQTLRRASGDAITALAVAVAALLIIAITLVALQKDPVGV